MPDHLSGGQRIRVALARAFVKDFRILVVDEPTNSLDRDNAKIIMALLVEIAKDHLVIATTHDTDLAEKYGDRIIHVAAGKVIDDSNPSFDQQLPEEKKADEEKRFHFPVRAINKLALHGTFHSIPRFIFSLFSSILALTAFMTTLSFVFYDEKETANQTYASENIRYACFLSGEEWDDGEPQGIPPDFDEIGDEEEFQAIFGKDLIYQRAAYEVEDSPYGMSGIPMALCVPNGDISAFGFDMVGKLTQGYG